LGDLKHLHVAASLAGAFDLVSAFYPESSPRASGCGSPRSCHARSLP
jgi:hypothetical protein